MKPEKNILTFVLASLIGIAGIWFLALFVNNIIHRLMFPYPMEYLEDAIFFHTLRIFEGKPIYADPDSGFAAMIYAPGYFYLLAGLFKLSGPSIITARFISLFCTISIFSLITWQSLKRLPLLLALVPPAIYLSLLYSHFAGYQDVGRVDPLMLLLVLAGIFTIDSGRRGLARNIIGILLITIACYVKQPALLYLPFIYAFLIFRDRKNGSIAVVVSLLFLLGLFFAANAATSGWFGYYTLKVPMTHTIRWERIGILIFGGHVHYPVRGILYLLLAFVIYGIIRLTTHPRKPMHILEAALPGSILATILPFMKEGGYFQDFIPLYTHLCLLLPLALSFGLNKPNSEMSDTSQPVLARLKIVILVCLLLHCAFSIKPLYEFRDHMIAKDVRIINPWTEFLPKPDNIRLGDDYLRKVESIEGDVLMPSMGYYAFLAGKQTGYVGVSLTDLVGLGVRPEPLMDGVRSGMYKLICLPEKFEAERYWDSDLSEFGYEGPFELIPNPFGNYDLGPNIERPPNKVYILSKK